MRRVFCLVLCLLMLSSFTVAAEDESLAEQLNSFIYSNGLSEENFALSYFNVDSGESYNFNEKTFFNAGEVWTLPLHMYYCTQEYHGAFLPEPNDPYYQNPDYEYTINGMNLDTCRMESILSGNQKVNETMREEVMQYSDAINEEFGHIAADQLPASYYTDNCYSTQFLMNCLIELERESEIYGDLMRLYDLVPQSDGFKSSDEPLTNKYKTVQIRGEENAMVCAVAEVTAPDTYLIACFVSQEAGGDRILAKLNALICGYVESVGEGGTALAAPAVGVNRTDSSFQVITEKPNDFSGVGKWILFALVGAIVVAILLYMIDRLIKYTKRRRHGKRK